MTCVLNTSKLQPDLAWVKHLVHKTPHGVTSHTAGNSTDGNLIDTQLDHTPVLPQGNDS